MLCYEYGYMYTFRYNRVTEANDIDTFTCEEDKQDK